MKIEEFWQMTWRDFSIYTTAWERNKLDQSVIGREIVYSILSSAGKTYNSLPAKEKLWPLPIDVTPEEITPPTQEEIQAMINRLQQPTVNKA